MVGGHNQIFDIILIDGLHSLDSLTASVLAPKVVHGHSLDIAQLSHGNDGALIRN